VQAVSLGIDNLTTDVRIVPAAGGNPSSGLKDEFQAYLFEKRAVNTEIAVNDPAYLNIDYNIEIWLLAGYQISKVVEDVRQSIVKFGSPIYKDADGLYPNSFGKTVSLSRLYRALMDVNGVERALVNTPATDLTMPTYQIRELGSIAITANSGGTQSSYQNLSTEL